MSQRRSEPDARVDASLDARRLAVWLATSTLGVSLLCACGANPASPAEPGNAAGKQATDLPSTAVAPDARSTAAAPDMRSAPSSVGQPATHADTPELGMDASAGPIKTEADAGSMQPAGPHEIASPEPSGVPLVERNSAGDYTCEVARPVSQLPIGSASFALSRPLALGGVAHVFWAERSGTSGLPDGPLKTARVGTDGVLQPAQIVFAPAADEFIGKANSAEVGHEQITLWWDYGSINEPVPLPTDGSPAGLPPGEDPTSGLVQLDAQGAALAPSKLFDLGQFFFDANVVPTSTGYLAVWGERSGTTCALELARLDANAKLIGTHVTLESFTISSPPDGTFSCGVIDVVATANGLALVYVRNEGERDLQAYRAFNANGEALGTATRLTPADTYPLDARLIAQGDDVLAVWTVAVGPTNSVGQLDATLRVARFGADGSLSGEVATLAAGRKGQFDRRPLWLDLGDALGLAFSREQKMDTSCTTACRYTGAVEYVVLNAADLTPRGAPVELPSNGVDPSGITATALAPNGDDLLVMVDGWTQAPRDGGGWSRSESVPASGTLHCDH